MRLLILAGVFIFSQATLAQNSCKKYEGQSRYQSAIQTVAQSLNLSFEELCSLPKVMDIEAQPSRIVSRDGEVIPHVRIQLHMAYESCLYMVRDSDQFISKQYCYSGF